MYIVIPRPKCAQYRLDRSDARGPIPLRYDLHRFNSLKQPRLALAAKLSSTDNSSPGRHTTNTPSKQAHHAFQLCEGLPGRGSPACASAHFLLSRHSSSRRGQRPSGRDRSPRLPLHIDQAAHRLEHSRHSHSDPEQRGLQEGGSAISIALYERIITAFRRDQGGRSNFDRLVSIWCILSTEGKREAGEAFLGGA